MAVDGGGDDPITQQIKELRNSVEHLQRSNKVGDSPKNPRWSQKDI